MEFLVWKERAKNLSVVIEGRYRKSCLGQWRWFLRFMDWFVDEVDAFVFPSGLELAVKI